MAKQYRRKKKDRRILGTQLYREIEEAGVFDRVVYGGPSGGQPGVYFEVNRGEYNAFIRWHSSPRGFGQEGYGANEDGSSRISLLSVSKGLGTLMSWDSEARPQGKKLEKENVKDPNLKKFLEDIVSYFG